MNIKINKDQFNFLYNLKYQEIEFGSKLYGTDSEFSDTDIMVFYNKLQNWNLLGYPNIHQFQFDDLENNRQYIFTTEEQFWKNQRSGDSTINSDIILFTNLFTTTELEKVAMCRTYKVLKAYLGFAKRDLKEIKKKHKFFHALRGLYVVQSLLESKLPQLSEIKALKQNSISVEKEMNYSELAQKYLAEEKSLRQELNQMFDENKIKKYYIPDIEKDLYRLMIEANNNKEFRY